MKQEQKQCLVERLFQVLHVGQVVSMERNNLSFLMEAAIEKTPIYFGPFQHFQMTVG
jgi:hypothetical protein